MNKGRHYRISSVKQTDRVSDSHFVRSDRFIKDFFKRKLRQNCVSVTFKKRKGLDTQINDKRATRPCREKKTQKVVGGGEYSGCTVWINNSSLLKIPTKEYH